MGPGKMPSDKMGLSDQEITSFAADCFTPRLVEVAIRDCLALQLQRVVAELRKEAAELAEFDEPEDASRAMSMMADRLEREGGEGRG